LGLNYVPNRNHSLHEVVDRMSKTSCEVGSNRCPNLIGCHNIRLVNPPSWRLAERAPIEHCEVIPPVSPVISPRHISPSLLSIGHARLSGANLVSKSDRYASPECAVRGASHVSRSAHETVGSDYQRTRGNRECESKRQVDKSKWGTALFLWSPWWLEGSGDGGKVLQPGRR
jgi:hypothetical protein